MGKHTIAECVEDEPTLIMLKSFGIDAVQGFHLERPHPEPTYPGRVAVATLPGTAGNT